MAREAYRVYFRVNSTDYTRVLQLDVGTESQAMYELQRSGALPNGATVIIKRIERA